MSLVRSLDHPRKEASRIWKDCGAVDARPFPAIHLFNRLSSAAISMRLATSMILNPTASVSTRETASQR